MSIKDLKKRAGISLLKETQTGKVDLQYYLGGHPNSRDSITTEEAVELFRQAVSEAESWGEIVFKVYSE